MQPQCGGGFGAGSFGSSPYGTGYTLSVINAVIYARNAVDVNFAGIPYAQDAAFAFSALVPGNWTLTVMSPYNAQGRRIQYVAKITDSTLRVYFDGDLEAYATYRLILAPTVTDDFGVPIDPFCASTEFLGLGTINPSAQTVVGQELRTDLANPQLERDAQQPPGYLGTYQIGANHDFALESGRAYLRKRVIRRATTSLGEFFHLPDYGFAEPLKGKITLSTLSRIQTRAQAQLLQEPDVLDAKVSVQVLAGTTDVVVLTMLVSDKYGNTDTIETQILLGP